MVTRSRYYAACGNSHMPAPVSSTRARARLPTCEKLRVSRPSELSRVSESIPLNSRPPTSDFRPSLSAWIKWSVSAKNSTWFGSVRLGYGLGGGATSTVLRGGRIVTVLHPCLVGHFVLDAKQSMIRIQVFLSKAVAGDNEGMFFGASM